jgi:hypothetical protein
MLKVFVLGQSVQQSLWKTTLLVYTKQDKGLPAILLKLTQA